MSDYPSRIPDPVRDVLQQLLEVVGAEARRLQAEQASVAKTIGDLAALEEAVGVAIDRLEEPPSAAGENDRAQMQSAADALADQVLTEETTHADAVRAALQALGEADRRAIADWVSERGHPLSLTQVSSALAALGRSGHADHDDEGRWQMAMADA